jgi:DNA sulfur modification protein DndC
MKFKSRKILVVIFITTNQQIIANKSVFDNKSIKEIHAEIQEVYLSDKRPWVIGFSGGKDSTATLQLIWYAISDLPKTKRTKPIYIISSNTLVESPILLNYLNSIHIKINKTAKEKNLPFQAKHIQPELKNTFWVNLLGKGYPAPTRMFRWCTDRLKIQPADKFILEQASAFGEVIVILGVRKNESNTRAQVMDLYKIKGSLLSRHSKFPQTFVYTPVEDFTLDDIWTYLLQKKSPWGANNRDLLSMYRTKDAEECPLVVDKTTPSCGGSRFGCWTCTLVSQDKSMQSLIEDGEQWMEPLLKIRDYLYMTTIPENKVKFREYRSRMGYVRFKSDGSGKISRGPYTLNFCKDLFKKLLEAQKKIEESKPGTNFKVILPEEIHEIRRLWLTERGDWNDSIPKIYKKIMNTELDWVQDDVGMFSFVENKLLDEVCKKHELPTELLVKLLDIERQSQGLTRRSLVYTKLNRVISQEWRSEEEVIQANSKKGSAL